MADAAMALRSQAEEAARRRLREIQERRKLYDSDLAAFAADCLTIRPAGGGERLFRFNAVQNRLHTGIEDQLKRTGRVRALVLKARKPGVSTYVEARFYHKTSRNRGRRAFILTHHQGSTDAVFDMAKLFHERNPHAPHTGASSAKELYFDELDSGFEVGTAGTRDIGRGYTIQYFHGSEAAFWPNAEMHGAGILKAVSDVAGTEIIIESTANGASGLFYNMCQAAMRGETDYELIFVPWFEHDEYAVLPPEDWETPSQIADYAALHDLDPAQAYWLFRQNADMAAKLGQPTDEICSLFRQEFPATVEEAFRAGREGSFIPSDLVLKARRFTAPAQDHAPLVLGCDFATGGDGEGGDRNVFIDRQGRAMGRKCFKVFSDRNTVSVASRLAHEIDTLNPAAVFMDTGGGGAQVHDILVDRGYGAVLVLVDFGSGALDGRKYANRRAEMAGAFREWLADPGGADLPDSDVIDNDVTATGQRPDYHGRTILEAKEKVRARLGQSPDIFDGGILTFAEPVRKVDLDRIDPRTPSGRSAGRSTSWMAV